MAEQQARFSENEKDITKDRRRWYVPAEDSKFSLEEDKEYFEQFLASRSIARAEISDPELLNKLDKYPSRAKVAPGPESTVTEAEEEKEETTETKPKESAEIIHNEATRKAEEITLSYLQSEEKASYAQLEEPEKSEKLREFIRKYWADKIAVHFRSEKGRTFSDLDGESALFLLKTAGINIKKVKYVPKGYTEYGRVNIDTGNEEGIVSLAGETFEGFTDQELEELGYQKTGIIDHHGETSKPDSSAAQKVYDLLVDLKMISPDKGLPDFIKFVTETDNMTSMEGLSAAQKKEAFEQSDKSLVGLSKYIRRSDIPKIIEFLGRGGDTLRPASDSELREMGLLRETGRKITLPDGTERPITIPEERKSNVEKSDELVDLLSSPEWGCAIDSPQCGKTLVDLGGIIPLGFEAAIANGFETYLKWSPVEEGFVLSTTKNIPEDFELPGGLKVRGKMIVKPQLDKTMPQGYKRPLETTLGLALLGILGEEGFRNISEDSKLGEYIHWESMRQYEGTLNLIWDKIQEVDKALEEKFEPKGSLTETYDQFLEATKKYEEDRYLSGENLHRVVVKDERIGSYWLFYLTGNSEKLGGDFIKFVEYDPVTDTINPGSFKTPKLTDLQSLGFLQWYEETASGSVPFTKEIVPAKNIEVLTVDEAIEKNFEKDAQWAVRADRSYMIPKEGGGEEQYQFKNNDIWKIGRKFGEDALEKDQIEVIGPDGTSILMRAKYFTGFFRPQNIEGKTLTPTQLGDLRTSYNDWIFRQLEKNTGDPTLAEHKPEGLSEEFVFDSLQPGAWWVPARGSADHHRRIDSWVLNDLAGEGANHAFRKLVDEGKNATVRFQIVESDEFLAGKSNEITVKTKIFDDESEYYENAGITVNFYRFMYLAKPKGQDIWDEKVREDFQTIIMEKSGTRKPPTEEDPVVSTDPPHVESTTVTEPESTTGVHEQAEDGGDSVLEQDPALVTDYTERLLGMSEIGQKFEYGGDNTMILVKKIEGKRTSQVPFVFPVQSTFEVKEATNDGGKVTLHVDTHGQGEFDIIGDTRFLAYQLIPVEAEDHVQPEGSAEAENSGHDPELIVKEDEQRIDGFRIYSEKQNSLIEWAVGDQWETVIENMPVKVLVSHFPHVYDKDRNLVEKPSEYNLEADSVVEIEFYLFDETGQEIGSEPIIIDSTVNQWLELAERSKQVYKFEGDR